MGLISDFMVFMKRSDVGLRNEWDIILIGHIILSQEKFLV